MSPATQSASRAESSASSRTVPAPSQNTATGSRAPTLRQRLASLPAFLIVALLAGLGWWGHHTGWKLPAFAALFGGPAQVKDDWCDEHGVPESECVECNPALFARPKQHGFCEVHGVHQCPLEHPEVAQLARAPVVTQAMRDRAARALRFKDWPENSPGCKTHLRLIQFASADAFDRMRVGVKPVLEREIQETVPASAEFTFEQPRVAPLYIVVSGRVWSVTSRGVLGAVVKKGDVLALVEAAEVGKAKAEFLTAYAILDLRRDTLRRQKELLGDSATSRAAVREAEAALREAEIRYLAAQQALGNLGLPIRAEEIQGLTPEQLAKQVQLLGLPPETAAKLDTLATANLLPVRATRDGTVIDVRVAEGEVVDPSRTLFTVADTSRMWLLLNVRVEDARFLQIADPAAKTPGNKVVFTPDGGGPVVVGELVWRSKVIDEKTRTLQFRADVAEPPATLAAHTYGKAQVVVRQEPKAVVVPAGSVHWEGDCHVVFVRDKDWFKAGSPKVFHVRSVRPGVTTGGYTEVIAGLLPGEVVAADNSTVLRAELLKNNLGAG